MTTGKIHVLLFLLALSVHAFGQKTNNIQHSLQEKIDSLRLAHSIPAMAFSCLLPSGELISVSSNMKPEQRMLAGSTGKTFFAALAFKLMANGKLSLDVPVKKYLGQEKWYNSLPNADSITIRMLMNHTSGIEEYYELGDFTKRLRDEPNKAWTPGECIAYVLNRKALFPAGKDWSYADTNYLILGMVLEKITGNKAYDDIDQYFLRPFKLGSTTPSVSRRLANMVNGITTPNNPFGIQENMIVNDSLVINPQMEWAGGGFVSNTIDLSRWAKVYYEASFTTEALKKEIRAGVPAKTGKNHFYGLGMQIRPSTLGMSYGHGGWFPGYLTEMDYFPDKNIAVTVQMATDDFQKLKRSPRYFEMVLTTAVAKLLSL
jgi:D-alanyl-D-alanine carboxypeptidase